ncbi:methylmalonyl-CoA epimerase [Cavenderia fasciculata]|uniref:Methylmalonyl-CoA epimerase, mitochondrial n=1 Tax=Cavenderia fasciculata TaxID=261658 RepID=F4PL91_CACFS|nr:methylmalonyl-CoA epimerase [Cavenderia fasciculata]EGG23313.1 methylmalonyl-CoA epimerase [Cavenderia fasciculata]|eukprot:XP_004361164.1 methylmalonyl-CoA epimerase [Cavenderia fasciculata]
MFRSTLRLFSATSSSSGVGSSIANTVGLGRLNHVAIAVPNMKEATSMYRDIMGAKVSEPEDQKEHGVTTVFVSLDNTKIELLHPLGENSPIANFLKKNPAGGVHHVCIEVDDINSAVKTLLDKQVRIIDPNPKIGAHGKPVVFLHPKSCNGVLVELEQK